MTETGTNSKTKSSTFENPNTITPSTIPIMQWNQKHQNSVELSYNFSRWSAGNTESNVMAHEDGPFHVTEQIR